LSKLIATEKTLPPGFEMRNQRAKKIAGPRKQRQGVAVVELAVTLPVLFLLLFACYEFGRANMIRHSVQGAAYEAARVAIVPGATVAEAEDTARYFLSSVGVRNFTLDVQPGTIDDTTDTVTVRISVNMRDNSTIGLLFNEGAVFEGRCLLNRETL